MPQTAESAKICHVTENSAHLARRRLVCTSANLRELSQARLLFHLDRKTLITRHPLRLSVRIAAPFQAHAPQRAKNPGRETRVDQRCPCSLLIRDRDDDRPVYWFSMKIQYHGEATYQNHFVTSIKPHDDNIIAHATVAEPDGKSKTNHSTS